MLSSKLKKISSPFATGDGGGQFENDVQSVFVVLMLTNGVFDFLSPASITKIKLQGKYVGYNVDDMIVYSEDKRTNRNYKMHAQIKHKLKFSSKDKIFQDTILAAWADYNSDDFNKKNDIIAIITSLMPEKVTDSVRQLLTNAKIAECFEDFVVRIDQKGLYHEQREKFNEFKNALNEKEIVVSDEELYKFLKCLHWFIYDLDVKGMCLSLTKTIIEQYTPQNSHSVWAQIKAFVGERNKEAATIVLTDIPDEITKHFKVKNKIEIPSEYLAKSSYENNKFPIGKYLRVLAQVWLIGSWNENSDFDKQAVSNIVQEDYAKWIIKIREILQYEDSPISFKNNVWSINDKIKLFKQIKSMIFDTDLDSFKNTAIIVLKEKDPKFELEAEQRYAASIYGKVLGHSEHIRNSIAENIAIIGSYGCELDFCSKFKAENTAFTILNELLVDTDWVTWAGLNEQLPLLFEASPSKMLDILANELSKENCIFKDLFNQETNIGFGSCCYMTGILWGLEKLAWSPEYLSSVTLILGELASIDPGGNYANRPLNSLISIFLPWCPQTIAIIEERKIAIKALGIEFNDITWKLSINLLPKQHQYTSGTAKPIFRNFIPEGLDETVLQKDYYEQMVFYLGILLEQAKDDVGKLSELMEYIENFPSVVFDDYLNLLLSDTVVFSDNIQKVSLWENLKKIIARHKHFPSAKWSLKGEKLKKIENVAQKLEPNNILDKYARYFDEEIFEEYENPYETGQKINNSNLDKKLERIRIWLLKILIRAYNIDDVVQNLLNRNKNPILIGLTLGKLDNCNYDDNIIPTLLFDRTEQEIVMAGRYVWSKFSRCQWDWVDSIDFSTWNHSQVTQFFINLPFVKETWERINTMSKLIHDEYWAKVQFNPYQINEHLNQVIDKLIQFKRTDKLVWLLNSALYSKQSIRTMDVVIALNLLLETPNNISQIGSYRIIQLIKYLQDSKDVPEEDLFKLELNYLPFLEKSNGAEPKILNKRLCEDPEFFCECIELLYKLENEEDIDTEIVERRKSLSNLASKLLHQWKKTPGFDENNIFNSAKFITWFNSVNEIITEENCKRGALLYIGRVLFYTPKDESGLFIDKAIAELFNQKESDLLRRGYRSEVINSRGIYSIEAGAKQEKALAAKYAGYSKALEKEGYIRFASVLKSIADDYEEEAKNIIEEYGDED